jgi:transcriptional regulator
MHVPQHFAADDVSARTFVEQIIAADLVTRGADGLVATFLPLIFEAAGGPLGSLLGHVARNNTQWRANLDTEALVIAHGGNGYVSPTWYATKAEHGRVVPTWDYVTAHVYGEFVSHDDPAWVAGLVRRLTVRHETPRSHPWSVDDAPPDYLAGQLRAIVGVEVVISRVEFKAKLSQNRSAADIAGVVAGFDEDGRPELARLVEQYRTD